jgi:hypothetical protein
MPLTKGERSIRALGGVINQKTLSPEDMYRSLPPIARLTRVAAPGLYVEPCYSKEDEEESGMHELVFDTARADSLMDERALWSTIVKERFGKFYDARLGEGSRVDERNKRVFETLVNERRTKKLSVRYDYGMTLNRAFQRYSNLSAELPTDIGSFNATLEPMMREMRLESRERFEYAQPSRGRVKRSGESVAAVDYFGFEEVFVGEDGRRLFLEYGKVFPEIEVASVLKKYGAPKHVFTEGKVETGAPLERWGLLGSQGSKRAKNGGESGSAYARA